MTERLAIFLPLLVLACQVSTLQAAGKQDYPIHPTPFTDVRITGGFWLPRILTNREVTVGYDFAKCEETGRIDNFAVAGGLKDGGFQGIFFNDSDVVKVVEGAAYVLAQQPDPALDTYLDKLIAKIAAAQEEDGYLYTARTINDPKYNFPGKQKRWSHLASGHELYNVGHMYEAAVAHYEATGKRTLLDVAIKNADLVCRVFGPGPGQQVDVPGHEEIEMGLVRLYRATGDEKYLRQARFFVDMRGRKDKRKLYGAYCQDHLPVVQQSEAVGHAVRAGYLYAGVADVAALTGERAYIDAIDRIWENIVSCKMHLTGGIGARHAGEAFGENYELPNQSAYLETCAAIANALFNHRMFLLHGDARYIDVLERVIYNGFLAGISLSGDRFFYPNPLACDGKHRFNKGSSERQPWFGCSCCPVNIVRFIPAIAGYVYAGKGDNAYVNLFIEGSGKIAVADGTATLTQQTRYPWDGAVSIAVDPGRSRAFALHIRIPGWARGNPVPGTLYTYTDDRNPGLTFTVNGRPVQHTTEKGYAVLKRTWKKGDTVAFAFAMPTRTVQCDERVKDNRGRVAIERGPLVYCAEGADHAGSITHLVLPDTVTFAPEHRPDLLGGVTVLKATAQGMMRTKDGTVQSRPAALTMIPYYAWCHRGPNQMAVWLPTEKELATVAPLPTIASAATPSASHRWDRDHIAALNDQVEPQNSVDHDIPRFTWWDHRGTAEWVQYTFAKPTRVATVSVYWFDDTGRGQCRVPASWNLLYRDGDNWKPVSNPSPRGTAQDRFNRVTFDAVKTDALRIAVQLQPNVSGGILEWTVE